MGRLFDVVTSVPELARAWEVVRRKGGSSAGVDGVRLDDFSLGLAENISSLHRELVSGGYQPSPLLSIRLPKKTPGEWRQIGIPTIKDRVIFHSLVEVLHYLLEPVFMDSSFAFRQGCGVRDAIDLALAILREGNTWAVRGDIRGCFDSMSWTILSRSLRRYVPDDGVRSLLNRGIRLPYLHGRRLITRTKGLPQGTGFSPPLANMYLHHFDLSMAQRGFTVIRYGDDWMILCPSRKEAERAWKTAMRELAMLEVEINRAKSGIFDLSRQEVSFLGFNIGRGRIDGDSSAWNRFRRCVDVLRDPESSEERRRLARSELAGIKAMYRGIGEF